MSEVGEFYSPKFETRWPFETEHADLHAGVAFEDAASESIDWDGPDSTERFYLLKKTADDATTYLIGRKACYDPATRQTLVTKYFLNLTTGLFVTPREYIDGEYSPFRLSSQTEIDIERTMYEMGQWYPSEKDWDDFMTLIDDAKKQAAFLKKQNANKPRTAKEILARVAQLLETHHSQRSVKEE